MPPITRPYWELKFPGKKSIFSSISVGIDNVDRAALRTERLPLRVELGGSWSRGRTVVDRRSWDGDMSHDPHGISPVLVDVGLEVDGPRYAALWLETVGSV